MPLIIFGSIFFVMGIVISIQANKFAPSGTCPQEEKDAKANKVAGKVMTIGSATAILIGVIVELLN